MVMASHESVTPRRTAADWVEAAYVRFHAEGIAGIRVEAIARDLGSTKGSFYWHFADRAALVTAVLERWEHDETESFIEEADRAPDPRTRLEVLFAAVARRRAPGEQRLYADAIEQGAGPVVERVTDRRVSYVAAALVELGVAPDEARRRGLTAVALVLGLEQLTRGGAADLVGSGEALQRTVLGILMPPV
jgi:AcrR family transcriptional regulator